MRIWLPILVLLIAAGSVAAFYLQAEGEEPSPLDKHLAAEAQRLAADPDAVEQEGAAWIAKQLGQDRSAKRLRELMKQRLAHVFKAYANRLKEEHPEFYDYPAHRARTITGSNGAAEIQAVRDKIDALHEDKRFAPMFHGHVPYADAGKETREAFLEESAPILNAVRKAVAADEIVFVLRRPEKTFLDAVSVEYPPISRLMRALVARAHMHLVEGRVNAWREEFTLALELVTRAAVEGSSLASLFHLVADQVALQSGALEFAKNDAVPTEFLREWLELGRRFQLDVVLALAVESADWVRIADSDERTVRNRAHGLERDDGFRSIEEHFKEARIHLDARMKVIEFAKQERPPLHTVEGIKAAHEFAAGLSAILQFGHSLHDAACSTWAWAGLELRILEREHGPLHENRELVDAALEAWPTLRAEWKGNTLELRAKPEYAPHAKSPSAAITLPPLKE